MTDKLTVQKKRGEPWRDAHNLEVMRMRHPIVRMLTAWLDYASGHRERYEESIWEDGVLGPDWKEIGRALLGVLNGDCGSLDCGTLDGVIRDALRHEGIDPNSL